MVGVSLLSSVDAAHSVASFNVRTTLIAAFTVMIICVIGAILKNRSKKYLAPTFLVLAAVVLLTTGIMTGLTIYVLGKSASGGLTHRSAGIEYWVCGVQLDIADPSLPLNNKIGSPSIHEHNDQQIHFEGVAINESDASLGEFQHAIGGTISNLGMILPVTQAAIEARTDADPVDPEGLRRIAGFMSNVMGENLLTVSNGEKCGTNEAKLQTFVYSMNSDGVTYTQRKIDTPFAYQISDEESVPNGDCIIVEFNTEKDRTEKLCREYGERDAVLCHSFGVPEDHKAQCTLRETFIHGSNES